MGNKLAKMAAKEVKEQERKMEKSDHVPQPKAHMEEKPKKVEEIKGQKLDSSSEPPKGPQVPPQQPGKIMQKLNESSAFRALSYEYYKNRKEYNYRINQFMRMFGSVSVIAATFGYLLYRKMSWQKKKYYLPEKQEPKLIYSVPEPESKWESD